MDDQLPLFASSLPRSIRLFLAIQPDAVTAADIHRIANDLRAIRGLGGQLRPASHLHVTLHDFGRHPDISAQLVQNIGHACANIAQLTRPFEVKFDQVLRFPGSGAFILGRQGGVHPALGHFHQTLGQALAIHGVNVPSRADFVPHVTLQYTRELVPPEPVAPVRWRVEEFVLLGSEGGTSAGYRCLGRWRLAAA